MSKKGVQLLAKQSLIPMAKENHQTPVIIFYLESNIEYHSKRITLKNWRNWN